MKSNSKAQNSIKVHIKLKDNKIFNILQCHDEKWNGDQKRKDENFTNERIKEMWEGLQKIGRRICNLIRE